MLKCMAFILTFAPMYVSEAVPQHGISYGQIIKNNPSLNETYAKELSFIIDRMAVKFGIRPERIAAILAQESMYKLDAINHKTHDYAIGQINIKTIRNFKFDKLRLLTDLEYSVWASAKVLHDFKKRYGKKEKNYWSRYNSSNKENRKIYERLVAKYEL